MISFPLSWNEDGKTALSVFYVLDGHEVEEFHPKESWLSGKHLLTLYYPIIGLTANQLHTFEVLISMQNGTGHIEAQNIMAQSPDRDLVCRNAGMDVSWQTIP